MKSVIPKSMTKSATVRQLTKMVQVFPIVKEAPRNGSSQGVTSANSRCKEVHSIHSASNDGKVIPVHSNVKGIWNSLESFDDMSLSPDGSSVLRCETL